jgi:hypothetical protein
VLARSVWCGCGSVWGGSASWLSEAWSVRSSVFSSVVALVLALRNNSNVVVHCSLIQSQREGMQGALGVNATCGCTQ